MYRSFYNLDNKPFEMNFDPSFLWFGENREEVFSTLRYAILDNKGLLVLTGDAGSGKTTLVKALTQGLDNDVEWAVIDDPRLERIDFYNAIAKKFTRFNRLGIEGPFTSKVQFLIQFSHFLQKANEEHKKVLLLVDDCHLLSQEMLEELRLLSNIEKADVKLLNIFFVGRPEFNDMLMQQRNRAIRQRLSFTIELHPLDVKETDDYICHRLKVAGTEEKLFTSKAIETIHQFSKGIPRRINSICEHALITGSVRAIRIIDDTTIESAVQDMKLSVQPGRKDFETFPVRKSDFIGYKEKIKSLLAQIPHWFSGLNFKNRHQRNWLKYAFGLLILSLAGIFFWFLLPHPPDIDRKPPVVPVEIAKVPVVEDVPKIDSLPAMKLSEENKPSEKKESEIIEEKQETENPQPEPVELSAVPDAPAAEVPQPAEVPAVMKIEPTPWKKVLDQTEDVTHLVQGKTKIVKMAPMEPRKIILQLRSDSEELTKEGQKELDDFIKKLKQYPRAKVLVKGFFPAQSNTPENIKLSEERAVSVQQMMLAKGIAAEQIEVAGMGNLEPTGSNSTSDGQEQNHRVEVVVVKDGT
jgi:general secretion pathway protein A